LLLVASDNDDRVAPFHSFKFLASVQEKTFGTNPHILYYAKRAGHSGNGSFANFLNENAYIYSFIFDQLGMEIRKWR
jgi:prolyl oligopeptidase